MMTKTPRVLGVSGEVGGIALYRLIMPFAHLTPRGYTCHWCTIDQLDRVDEAKYDVIVLSRIGVRHAEYLAEFRRRLERWQDLGKKLVFELDDDMLGIPDHNWAKLPDFAARSMTEAIIRADLLTVSNQVLADRYRDLNPNIAILPDCIDPDSWTYLRDKLKQARGVAPGRLTVGCHGGDSHVRDWLILKDVLPVIAKRHPEVHFVFAGYHPEWLDTLHLEDRLTRLAFVPVEHYPIHVAQIDIGLCPLEDIPFNYAKEPIKHMEHAMCSAPTVCSPIVYDRLVDQGYNGFLAQEADEWISSISKLIESPDLRRRMGKAARAKVLRRRNIHDLAPLWMQAYRKVWGT